MPRYRYTGSFEIVLSGLAHGVNAVLHRKDDHGQPDGSTLVAEPGDVVETDEPYEHALLELVKPPAKKAAAKKAAAKPDTKQAPPASEPAAPATTPTPEGQE